jgi:hypothetical protein
MLVSIIGFCSIFLPSIVANAGDADRESCIAVTRTLAESTAIIMAYEGMEFANAIETQEGSTMSTVVIDYSVNQLDMRMYHSICTKLEGVYEKLDFIANCTKVDNTSNTVIYTERLRVVAFPRCYGQICTDNDANELFHDFTLRPTELLNQKHSKSYTTCTGTLLYEEAYNDTDSIDAVGNSDECKDQELAVLQNPTITNAFQAMIPSVNRDLLKDAFKETGVDSREMIQLSYDEALTNVFQQVCEENGFVYLETRGVCDGLLFQCHTASISRRVLPLCIGKSCNATQYMYNFETMKKQAISNGGVDDSDQFQCIEVEYIAMGRVPMSKLVGMYLALCIPFLLLLLCLGRAMVRGAQRGVPVSAYS